MATRGPPLGASLINKSREISVLARDQTKRASTATIYARGKALGEPGDSGQPHRNEVVGERWAVQRRLRADPDPGRRQPPALD